MRFLLDTHVYLWWLRDDRSLGAQAREALEDGRASVFVSAASIWEVSIKFTLGRLDIGDVDVVGAVEANGFQHLPVTAPQAWLAGSLPTIHGDPFDRVLVAQAIAEDLVLVTADEGLSRYGVGVLAT